MIKKILVIFLLVIFLTGIYFLWPKKKEIKIKKKAKEIKLERKISQPDLVLPIIEFQKRITKKPFGIYITPDKSPVTPERFYGYHTGVDVEYQDKANRISITAITDGEIILAKWLNGYGGTLVLKFSFQKETYYALYGHLNLQSMTKKTLVKKGETLAILGEGETIDTDHERKHLHFAISKQFDTRGYISNKAELNLWLNPREFF